MKGRPEAGPGAEGRPGPIGWDPFARALRAYRDGDTDAGVMVSSDGGGPRWTPVSLFFRGPGDFAPHHRLALDLARGRVLEVGAAAGALSLALQDRGLGVTALDAVPEAVEIMRERGVEDARCVPVLDFHDPEPFDTVLLLMNGSMIAGTLEGLARLLGRLEGLLAPGGQVLMDSTDVTDDQVWETDPEAPYPGELHFQLEFEGERGPPFPQLFVDPSTLDRVARQVGLVSEVVWTEAVDRQADAGGGPGGPGVQGSPPVGADPRDDGPAEGSFLSRLTRRP